MIYKTSVELKHERECLQHQIKCITDEAEKFEIRLTPEQIETLASWMLSPSGYNPENPDALENWWYFPTKLSDWLDLASKNNLPPKTLLAWKEWEIKNKWREQFTTDEKGFMVRKINRDI